MSTVVVQEPVEPLVLGEVVGYGGADTVVDTMSENESIAEAGDQFPQEAPVKVYAATEKAPLASQSTSSLESNSTHPKRQSDFEKLFSHQLKPTEGEIVPDDFYTVVHTQSADLQASVLLHGRLYLTRYHICFRSNIMGYVTENIHDLKEITSVEKSTTAKWIQNAVSITLDTKEDDKAIGYGSMGDRDAMYACLMEVWKDRAPDRWSAHVEKSEAQNADADPGSGAAVRQRSATTATKSGNPKEEDTTGRHRSATAAGRLDHDETAQDDDAEEGSATTGEAKETKCSGEHFAEVALDTTLPVQMEQLFNLMYHTPEFGQNFLENKQKLTDVDVSEWADKGGSKERTLKYVMHMNNYIGPKKSDCIGSERVEVENPDEAYEIVSETQTPDVPSGKSFKIHTRTCLTHTVVNNAPATRMYCTTQCDWSSSSMLKGTITPAVIKGQKEYHQAWLGAIKDWIKAHPDDFSSPTSEGDGSSKPEMKSESDDDQADLDLKRARSPDRSNAPIDSHVVAPATAMHESTDITKNQPMMMILLVCVLSLMLNVYLVTK